jgi:DNA-binding CsgD family transcriptional regulator
VTAGVLPDRHLIRLDPVARSSDAELDGIDMGGGSTAPTIADTPGPRGPTAREREVLALLAGGATDGQIATMLELSPATVQTHVRNAKAKLGAKTRAQAVALAIQRSLITPR